jgi:hypothetical protein
MRPAGLPQADRMSVCRFVGTVLPVLRYEVLSGDTGSDAPPIFARHIRFSGPPRISEPTIGLY